MAQPFEADLQFAHSLADAAERVALSYFRKQPREWSKPDNSIVTEADLAVEDEIRRMVAEHRPDEAMLGEERGQTGAGPRRWIVDGIDGTIEFAAGVPNWGTLVALEVEGEVVVGVCHQPVNRRRYWAMKGNGAWKAEDGGEPRALSVNHTSRLSAARAYIPPEKWLPTPFAKRFIQLLRDATIPTPQVNHPAVQFLEGGYDLVPFQKSGTWDIAAFSLIAAEAGGGYTSFDGDSRIDTGAGFFTTGPLREHVLRLIESARRPA